MAKKSLPLRIEAKKVSDAGSVSGLKSMAGSKVLVLSAPDLERAIAPARELVDELGADLRKQGRIALGEFRRLRERHLKTEVPGARRLMRVLPAEARPAIRKADAWIRENALKLEKGAERVLAR